MLCTIVRVYVYVFAYVTRSLKVPTNVHFGNLKSLSMHRLCHRHQLMIENLTDKCKVDYVYHGIWFTCNLYFTVLLHALQQTKPLELDLDDDFAKKRKHISSRVRGKDQHIQSSFISYFCLIKYI